MQETSSEVLTLGIARPSIAQHLASDHEIPDNIAVEIRDAPMTDAQKQKIDSPLATHHANFGVGILFGKFKAVASVCLFCCLAVFMPSRSLAQLPDRSVQVRPFEPNPGVQILENPVGDLSNFVRITLVLCGGIAVLAVFTIVRLEGLRREVRYLAEREDQREQAESVRRKGGRTASREQQNLD